MKSRLRKVNSTQYPQIPVGFNPEMAVVLQQDKSKEKKDYLEMVYKDFQLDQNSKEQEKNLYTF